MKKHFIIDLVAAGVMSAVLLTGCGKSTALYCTTGMDKIESCNYEGAIADFNGEISKNPGNRDAYRGLGIAYYKMNNIPMASIQFQTVIDKTGKNKDDIYYDSVKYYADCLARSGNYEQAIQYYTLVLDKVEGNEKAAFLYLRGCAYIHLKNENNAALDFESSINLNGSDYSVYCNMYNAFLEAGYKDRAESYLKRLINANNADDFLIGKTYYIFGNYDLAETFLEQASDAGKKEANYFLALTYEAEEKYTEADDLYRDFISKNPTDGNIYNQYGAYLINRKQYENALVYIETGLDCAKEPAKKALLYNQAICYEYTGDFSKAYELLEKYVSQYSNDADAYKEYTFLKSRQN